ncbi:hypothetical protein MTO96_004300 [Rhipicephalus appendiculatus]
MEDVKIDNVTESVAALGIAGPHSANVLASLTDVPLSDDKFPFLHARNISISGIPVTALRVSYTGELGWELYHDRKHTAALYSQLLRFGEPYDITDFGTYALNSLRVEKGFRLWGADMTVDTNPFEGWSWAKPPTLIQKATRPSGVQTRWSGTQLPGSYGVQTEQSLAMAYLPMYLAIPGSEVQVELLGKLCRAAVLPSAPVPVQVKRRKAPRTGS